MNFIKPANSEHWYKWIENEMIMVNINDGFTTIDENDPNFMYAVVETADNWAELLKKKHYNPWAPTGGGVRREMWIDPNGEVYDCGEWGAHEITAQNILEKKFNETETFWDCGDKLIERGWVKVSCGVMNTHYHEAGMYDHMTKPQADAYAEWRNKYD